MKPTIYKLGSKVYLVPGDLVTPNVTAMFTWMAENLKHCPAWPHQINEEQYSEFFNAIMDQRTLMLEL